MPIIHHIKSQPFEINIDNGHERQTCTRIPIILISQFYLPQDQTRLNEVQICLRLNLNNEFITKIYLLNETIYTDNELGLDLEQFSLNLKEKHKLVQIDISRRLTYDTVFKFARQLVSDGYCGYFILSNSDIWFDNSLNILSDWNFNSKSFICLTRSVKQAPVHTSTKHNNSNKTISNLNDELISVDSPNSNDSWIWPSVNTPMDRYDHVFNYGLGTPGCDNVTAFVLAVTGYELINNPEQLRGFHLHENDFRTYDPKVALPSPYLFVYFDNRSGVCMSESFDSLNKQFSNYLATAFKHNLPFIVPRVEGIENNFVFTMAKAKARNKNIDLRDHGEVLKHLKNNAGINITSLDDAISYMQEYLGAFKRCGLYFNWNSHWGEEYLSIMQSQDWLSKNLRDKRTLWAHTLDIFNFIEYRPWTQTLKGKRILIISSFIETIQKQVQVQVRDQIYKVDLFPDCTFIYLKPPPNVQDPDSNQSQSRSFREELDEFLEKLKVVTISDGFDIALVGCGGYGNIIIKNIYDMGKSAINVGDVLQMYFGIIGKRWEVETPNILKIYRNEYWVRPDQREV